MSDTQLIEQLKDPKKAQPYYVLSMKAKGMVEKAGPQNRLWLNRKGKWIPEIDSQECNVCHLNNTYILNPDYQPEPEYVDYKIIKNHELYGTHIAGVWQSTYKLVSMQGFEEFWYDDEGSHITPYPHDIPKLIRKGYTLYARFRKGES